MALSDHLVPLADAVRRHPVTSVLALQIWLAYAAYQLWIVVLGPIGYWNDTISYVAVARASFPSRRLLAGDRPPLVPLVWKLTGSPLSFAVVQTLVGIVAWTALALSLAALARPGWRRLVAATAVLAFASCWQVTEWNWNVLSESLALSAVAMACAASIWLARRLTILPALALFVACALLLAGRDQAIWVVGPLGAGLGAWEGLRCLKVRAGSHPVPAHSRRVLVLALALLAAALVAEAGAAASHRNVVNMKDVFAVRVFPFSARVSWFAHNGMPQAPLIDTTAQATPASPGQAKVVSLDFGTAEWRRLDDWFGSRSETAYEEFLLTHPGYDLTAPFAHPPLTFNNAGGNLAVYGSLVATGGGAAANHALPFLPVLMFPSWKVELVVAAIASLLLVGRKRWRRREVAVLAILLAAGLWSLLTGWHGDGMEVARHTLEGNIQVRIAVLGIGVLAVLGDQGPLSDGASPPAFAGTGTAPPAEQRRRGSAAPRSG